MGTQVNVIPDTNFFMEFGWQDQAEWRLLFPAAEKVAIVLVPKVIAEIDEHKKKSGRLRKRAQKFAKLLLQMEESDLETLTVSQSKLELVLQLAPFHKNSELDTDQFELSDADSRIVAEALATSKTLADVHFLSDDFNPRRRAKISGMNVIRPRSEWRVADPEDERDVAIRELQAQIGAVPKLVLKSVHGESLNFGEISPETLTSEELEAVKVKIFSSNKVRSVDDLFGMRGSVADRRHVAQYLGHSLTNSQISKYIDDIEEYRFRLEGWPSALIKSLNQSGILPFRLRVANEGSAFAEHVEIQISASKGYNLFNPNPFLMIGLPRKPEQPQPSHLSAISVSDTVSFEDHIREREENRYRITPVRDESPNSDSLLFRCERFPHGTDQQLLVLVGRKSDAPDGGALTIQVRSSTVSKIEKMSVPFQLKPMSIEDSRAALIGRLDSLTVEAADAVRAVISESQ